MRPGSHRARTPPPREGIRGLWSLVCAKGIHLRRTWAQVSGTRPRGRSLGRPLEPWGPGLGIFPGALSGPRRPLSPGECPRRPLTPAGRLHPAISGPTPPWSRDTWGRGASNRPTWRETRRPLRLVPTTVKNRGEAPRRWLLSEQRLAGFRPSPGAAHAQAVPPTQASLGATGPTLEISGGVHKVPGLGPGTRKPSLHRTGRRVFPRTILFSRSPTPAETECPGKTWAPGAGARGRPRFHARWRWTGRAGRRPLEEFSLGTQACALLRG